MRYTPCLYYHDHSTFGSVRTVYINLDICTAVLHSHQPSILLVHEITIIRATLAPMLARGTSYGVCQSVRSRSSAETSGRIGLTFGTEASFNPSHTAS